jgi:hypothetical protein
MKPRIFGLLTITLLALAPVQSRAWYPHAVVSFCAQANCADGAGPGGGLIADANGNLIGTTGGGGASGGGTVFEIAKTATGYASTPTILVSFCPQAVGSDCFSPFNGVIADAAGNLFGATPLGGAHGTGTVFEIKKTATGYASTPTVLYSFCAEPHCADGFNPLINGRLLLDTAGNLFGTAENTVFEIKKTAGGYASAPTTLYSFCALANCADGNGAEGGLIADAAGNLFGTTRLGGVHGGGTVFELAKTATGYASSLTILYSFCAQAGCADGSGPRAGLIADAAGDLFGTTADGGAHGGGEGGGTVFEIAKTATGYASTQTILYNFCAQAGCADGAGPRSDLIADAVGNLFGTTAFGGVGPNKEGVLFVIAKTAGGYTSTINKVSFCAPVNSASCANGGSSGGGLFADANGNLLGTASIGGAHGAGTVFESIGPGFVTDAPFASLSGRLLVTGGQHRAFNLDARFRLAAGSSAINPPSQPVTLQIGPYTVTIPPDSFRQLPAGKHSGVYAFHGKISDMSLALDILPMGRNSYQFAAAGRPVDFTAPSRVPVALRIGPYAGSTVVSAVRRP